MFLNNFIFDDKVLLDQYQIIILETFISKSKFYKTFNE